jgi:hypothetical protein
MMFLEVASAHFNANLRGQAFNIFLQAKSCSWPEESASSSGNGETKRICDWPLVHKTPNQCGEEAITRTNGGLYENLNGFGPQRRLTCYEQRATVAEGEGDDMCSADSNQLAANLNPGRLSLQFPADQLTELA